MRKYLVLGALVILAGVVINYSLGGFKKIDAELITVHDSIIFGALYEGGHSSDSLNNQIVYFRNILNASGQPGTLTIVNYTQPSLEKRGLVKQFIGIQWENDAKDLIQIKDSLTIDSYNGFQFRVPIKPLVMPSPEKLKRLAKEAAEMMDGELAGYSIEQYRDNSLIINFPLK